MVRINLEELRTFLVVVRSGGIGKAAHALSLTQPAVTARIKSLERSLGAPLLDRHGGGVRLTKRGELLLQHVLKLEALVNQIERDVVEPSGVEGHLRIGASETIAQCWLPDFISALRERFPALQIELNVDVSSSLRDGLLAREIDLAFLLGPVSEHSVENVELPPIELAWYTVPSDVGTDGAEVLFGKPVITYSRGTRPYREMRDRARELVGTELSIFPSSSLSACLRLVEKGVAVAALPRALGDPRTEVGRLAEFDPGWKPAALGFTASYLGDPPSHTVERAAALAARIARAWDKA